MWFDDIDDGRLGELLRFGVVLSGTRAVAERLMTAAVVRLHDEVASPEFGAEADALATALRTWMTRAYLSEGMQLGRGVAADVDIPDASAADADAMGRADWDDLAARLVTSSKLQRAVVVLRYYSELPDEEIARVLGSTWEGIARYVSYSLQVLQVAPAGDAEAGSHGEAELRELLDLLGDDVADDEDLGALRVRVTAPALVAAGGGDPAADTVGTADTVESEPGSGVSWVDIVEDARASGPGAAGGVPAGPPALWAPRPWLLTGALVGVIVAVVVVVVVLLVLLATRGTTTGALPRGSVADLPDPLRHPLPTTRVLRDFAGAGPDTLRFAAPKLATGRQLAVAATCAGSGAAHVGVIEIADCGGAVSGNTVLAADPAPGASALHVVSPADTRWRVQLVDQPFIGSGAALVSPVPAPLTAAPPSADIPAVLARARGRGDAALRVPGSGSNTLRVELACGGNGVTLADTATTIGTRVAYACFDAWSYQYTVTDVRLPTTLHVTSRPATTWQVAVLRD